MVVLRYSGYSYVMVTYNILFQMLEYEYEPEMEDSYRADFLKSFKKTVEKGYFSFIIIDAVNDKVKALFN